MTERIGIVGSRRRNKRRDRAIVWRIVKDTRSDAVIVSGGASGPDTFAEEAAAHFGRAFIKYEPDLLGARSYPEIVERYYARNERIAANVDVLHALVAPDRKGGTENTIEHAHR